MFKKTKRRAILTHLAFSIKRSLLKPFFPHIYTFLESLDRDELNAVLLSYTALLFAEKNDYAYMSGRFYPLTDMSPQWCSFRAKPPRKICVPPNFFCQNRDQHVHIGLKPLAELKFLSFLNFLDPFIRYGYPSFLYFLVIICFSIYSSTFFDNQ